MKGRVVTVAWRRIGAVTVSAFLALGLVPAVAAGGTHEAAVTQAEARLSEARGRQAALSAALDQMAEGFERAQAHQLRLQEELVAVEREVADLRVGQVAARESLRRRVHAAFRAPHTDLALASAVLDAPDAATALHRAGLMARLAVTAAHEVDEIDQAEVRARDGLRQRRLIEAGARAAADTQLREAERLSAALVEAARQVRDAEERVEDARRRARAAAEAAARATTVGAPVVLPRVDGKVCPVGGPHGFIDSWGFPRSGGRRHQGVDMFAEHGTPLLAVADGEVRRVYMNRLGGLSIDLVDTDGHRYYYAHLASAAVEAGTPVAAGDVIGAVGNTGNARGTPPHLHWQYHPNGGPPVNPFGLAHALCR